MLPGRPALDDTRPWHQRLTEQVQVWTYIVGLSTLLIVWTLIAWSTIGSGTITYPDYHLPDTTPASQPYNTVGTYQRLQR